MVKDAEANADEDRKFKELVDTRNQADGMIHAVNKSLTEAGDKVTEEERKPVDEAIEALKEALKSDDKQIIEDKLKVLTDASGAIAQKLYANAETPEGGAEQTGEQPAGDDVVDAEFEEVDESKK